MKYRVNFILVILLLVIFPFKLSAMLHWETPENFEKRKQHLSEKIQKALLDVNKIKDKALYFSVLCNQAMELEDEDLINLLIKNKVNIDLFGNGLTLRNAVSTGNLKIMKLLLEGGAQINLQADEDGAFPLFSVSEYCFFDLEKYKGAAKFLIDHGAKINLCDKNNQTALIKFVIMYQDIYYVRVVEDKNLYDVLKLLIFADADTQIKDKDNKTVFDYARPDLEKLLKQVVEEYFLSDEYNKKIREALNQETTLISVLNDVVLNYLGFEIPISKKRKATF